MRTYLVGGAVRDALMGVAAGDRDWVVVGTTPEAMQAQGFQPVGRDFPVFLHPQTHEEYALARTERKTAPGYHGFAFHADPSVSLEDDLARRDLRINAMAQDAHGTIIDPYGGRQDLAERVLRHVGPAFAEDPVRILRLARFAARWPSFSVAEETLILCRRMVADGEVAALVPERVWQELSRGLLEPRPSRMLQVLRACGALAVLLPEVDQLYGVPQRAEFHPEVDPGVQTEMVMDVAARLGASLPVRFAALVHDLGKGTTPRERWPRHIGHEARSLPLLQQLADRWRVPVDCRELGELVAREHACIHGSAAMQPEALVRLLGRCDAWRRPDRFAQMLLACECDARGRLGFADTPYPQAARLQRVLALAQGVAAGPVAAEVRAGWPAERARSLMGEAIAQALEAARVQAVAQGLGTEDGACA